MFAAGKILFATALTVLVASACTRNESDADTTAYATPRRTAITIGDIYPQEPATRVLRIQPLADFLGASLGAFGIDRGSVDVSSDIASMAALLKNGDVDLFIDSAYPVLAVNRLAGSQSILLNKALDEATYQSVLITRVDSKVARLRDLLGSVIVFQSPHSTSGFLLPAAYIMEAGYQLKSAPDPGSQVKAGYIGCTFAGDETRIVELVLNGAATAGAISNQDLRELPEATRARLKVFAKTNRVPRQLVAVRSDLAAPLTRAVIEALLNITDAQRAELAAQDAPLGWTWKFAPLTPVMQKQLTSLEHKFDLLPNCSAAP